MSFFWPDIDKVVQDIELKEKKAAVKGNSNAYYDFFEGEQKLDVERNQAKETFDVFYKRISQKLGFYEYAFATEYNEKASRALLSICNDISVKSWHISDLLEAGADPNYCDGRRYNETPIYGAIRASNIDAIKILVKAGANVKHTDTLCRTPLMLACDSKQHGARVSIVKYEY